MTMQHLMSDPRSTAAELTAAELIAARAAARAAAEAVAWDAAWAAAGDETLQRQSEIIREVLSEGGEA